MRFTSVAADLLGLFFPRGCLGCGDRVPPEDSQGLLCPRCCSLLRAPPPPLCVRCQVPLGTGHAPGEDCLECLDWPPILVTARAAVLLQPPAGEMVHALKYRGWEALAGTMAGRMAREAPRKLEDPILVPVPTTPWRLRTRGYNQAQVLADELARELGSPVVSALARQEGRTQVSLGPQERASNVHGAFQVDKDFGSRIRGREVILVDDVLTTGATAVSAARTLGDGGAKTVHLLTFARALPFSEDKTE